MKHRLTRLFALAGKGCTFGHEIIFEAIHQHHISRLVEQLLTFIISNLAHRSKTVHVVCGLLLDGVL